MKKILIFHPIIAPYRIDFFNALAENFDSRICMFWRNLKDQTFDYSKIERQLHFNPIYIVKEEIGLIAWIKRIWTELSNTSPDIVLGAEFGLSTFIIILHRFIVRRKYKIVVLCDDSYHMVSQNSHFTRRHALAIKFLLPHIDQIVNPEPRVSEWYQKKHEKGFFFPIICDDEIARERQKRVLPISERYISSFNLKGKKVLLFVGRLVPFKNIEFAINSFLKANIKDSVFVIVGGGELEGHLRKMTHGYNNIIVAGRYEGDALYAWYNVAQLFTLPSILEPFGAVTNEALVAGCKCLISKDAGSNCLISDGENGFIIEPNNQELFVKRLIQLMERIEPLSANLIVKPNMMVSTFRVNIENLIKEFNR